MQALTKRISYGSRADSIRLYYLTDLHVGARAFDEKRLRKDVAIIAADPSALWGGGGDYMDAICHVGDKRYRPSMMAERLLGEDDVMGAEVDWVLEILRPIAPQCAWLVDGNHEDAALKWYGRDVYWEIVKGIAKEAKREPETLALGVNGFVQLIFRQQTPTGSSHGWTLQIYCHHGIGGGVLHGGDALALGRVLGWYDCDLALIGHRHKSLALSQSYTRVSARYGIRSEKRSAAFVPSYLGQTILPSSRKRPIDTYPERKMLPPSVLGHGEVLVWPGERQFKLLIE